MRRIHGLFLQIIRSAIRGEKMRFSQPLNSGDWQELLQLAKTHQVLPLFYDAVYAEPSLREMDPASLTGLRRDVRFQVMRQTRKTDEFLSLYQALRAENAAPLVVKGIICRNIYPKSDLRPSGDEDLLAPGDRFIRCRAALEGLGMEIVRQSQDVDSSYELPMRKKDGVLYVELHKHLFSQDNDAFRDFNQLFQGAVDRAMEIQIQGVPVRTLSHTDHMLYLLCHAFKHFLFSGFGIRQVSDIILFAEQYGSGLGWAWIQEQCRKIHADRFAATLFRIGRKHLGFDDLAAHYPKAWLDAEADEAPLLEDLLLGGLYGDANLSRVHSSNMTLSTVSAQKTGSSGKSPVLTSLFPSAKTLSSKYAYLKKYPILLPVAWCDRIVKYGIETGKKNDSSAAEALKIGKQRIELMRYYDIIE